jgi:hypothetical protein
MTVSFNLNSTANDRLADSSEYKLLLENMSVLMKEYWPFDTNGDYGPNQIRYLCERFDLEFEHNLSIFKLKLYSEGKCIPAGLVPLINLLKIIRMPRMKGTLFNFTVIRYCSSSVEIINNYTNYTYYTN